MINEELIRAVAGKIRQIPGDWDQAAWVSDCGTKFCFAGWALRLSGYGVMRTWSGQAEFAGEDGERLNKVAVGGAGEFEVARNLLGLSHYQAEEIFFANGRGVQEGDVDEFLTLVSRETGIAGL